jgi:hypothetical protein
MERELTEDDRNVLLTRYAQQAALLIAGLGSLVGSKKRRREVRDTILNINEALELYTAGRYFPNRAINPEPPQPGIRWYEFAAIVGCAGVMVMLWTDYLTCK